ncbi:uncharacterized protein [Neodiprion pinetum]|uniref:Uncharacterized protein LOC107219833 n=1 Tax=Neodiprion lecontei TaxID=441921 RepID=A0A6J0BJS0_NEOLC|nr:uncharacterized protein LOC107219833 [Neodiprion lecontei]XP_046477047.1 uncharacterized protein LOC124216516 [Neodiprion pinetum]XP_046614983.1 uncharacterized protein LOC124302656 [Neodiprion virginianus]
MHFRNLKSEHRDLWSIGISANHEGVLESMTLLKQDKRDPNCFRINITLREILQSLTRYRSVTQWLDRMKDDAPAFLTITSLQLPDSPIPLIDSQAISRCQSQESARTLDGNSYDKDDIMDELLRKVVAVRGQTETQRSKRNKGSSSKCSREFTDLEESTRRIIEGPGYSRGRSRRSTRKANGNQRKDCTCSEVSNNLRINIRKKTEIRRSSRSPSPEVTHVIRIAMRYHGQEEGEEGRSAAKPKDVAKDKKDRPATVGQEGRGCCPGVSVALDFTLNCSSLHLTSRDVPVKPSGNTGSLTRLDQSDENSGPD